MKALKLVTILILQFHLLGHFQISFSEEFQEALGNNLTWETSGSQDWFEQATVTFEGASAAQSGKITHNGESVLSTTVNLSEVKWLEFVWRVSSEEKFDAFDFKINDEPIFKISGAVDWQKERILLATGEQTLQWHYKKDSLIDHREDTAWLDSVALKEPIVIDKTLEDVLPSGFTWEKGNEPWTVSVMPYGNLTTLQSAPIADSTSTSLQTSLTGPVLVTFYWRISSEDQDNLSFSIGNKKKLEINGITNWSNQKKFFIPKGEQTIKWEYTKNASTSSGLDRAWLVDVKIEEGNFQTAIDAPFSFTTQGEAPWSVKAPFSSDELALQSGTIGDNQSSILEATVEGPGRLVFEWRISSEAEFDQLVFSVDGAEKDVISGIEPDWLTNSTTIDSGSHTLSWNYRKDSDSRDGLDAGWLKSVQFSQDTDAPTGTVIINDGEDFTETQNVTLQLSALDNTNVVGYKVNNFPTPPTLSSTFIDIIPATSVSLSINHPLFNSIGTKFVYVWFLDDARNIGGPFFDDIYFQPDTSPPEGTMTVNGNASFTVFSKIFLALSAKDESTINKYQIALSDMGHTSDEGFIDIKFPATTFDKTIEYPLPEGDYGEKTIYVWFSDKYGNISDPLQSTIDYKERRITPGLSINSNKEFSSPTSVPIVLKGTTENSEIVGYYFSGSIDGPIEEDIIAITPTKDFELTINQVLPEANGVVPYYLWFKMVDGDIVGPYSGSTKVDSTRPTTTTNITSTTHTCPISVHLECDDTGSGCGQTRYTLNGSEPDENSNLYNGTAIEIQTPTMLTFFSVDQVGNPEKPEQVFFQFDGPETTITPTEKDFVFDTEVQLTCRGADSCQCDTFYTTAPNTAHANFKKYEQPFVIQNDTVVRYFSQTDVGKEAEKSKIFRFTNAENQADPKNEVDPNLGGCFIATAAYGSDMRKELDLLREFRDQHLLTNRLGKRFVDYYYYYSPPIAEVISQNEAAKLVVRSLLTPIVYSLEFPVISLLLFLGNLYGIAWRLRKRFTFIARCL